MRLFLRRAILIAAAIGLAPLPRRARSRGRRPPGPAAEARGRREAAGEHRGGRRARVPLGRGGAAWRPRGSLVADLLLVPREPEAGAPLEVAVSVVNVQCETAIMEEGIGAEWLAAADARGRPVPAKAAEGLSAATGSERIWPFCPAPAVPGFAGRGGRLLAHRATEAGALHDQRRVRRGGLRRRTWPSGR